MKLFKSQKNRKVLYKYLVSFILVFIIPSIFVVWFFNRYTSNMIISKAENELTSKFVRNYDEMEKRMNNVMDLALRLSLDSATQSIANTSEVDPDILINMSEYSKKLNEICVFNSYIKSVAMHIRSKNIILSERGNSGFYIYFNQLKKTTGILAEDMLSILDKRNYIYIVPLTKEQSKTPDYRITIIQSFPINVSEPVGSIILTVDKSILTQVIGSNDDDVHDDFLLADANGNVLISKTSSTMSKDVLAGIIRNKSTKIQHLTINGQKSLAFCKKSSLNQWWYIYHLPETEMTSSIFDFKRLMSVIIIVYLMGGIFISLALALMNYSPLRSLINEIVRNDLSKLPNGIAGKAGIDEYDIIKKSINDLYTEKNILNSKINSYLGEVKSNFLRDLTIEGLESSKFEKLSETLNLKFIYQNYCFIAFSCVSPDDLSTNDVNKTFFILDMIEETAVKFGTGHKFILGKDLIGLIINVKERVTIDEITTSYNWLVEYVKATYDRQLFVGTGSIYSNYSSIPLTYNEACDAIKYSMFYCFNIFTYNEMMKISQKKYSFPSETAAKLFNCLEAGDFESSDNILTQVMEINFKDNVLSLNEVQKLYYDFMGILKKAADKFNSDLYEFCAIDRNSSLKNENFRALDEMGNALRSLYGNACSFIRERRSKAQEGINTEIMKYITDNYFDANLSCSYIADKFNISQSYLSNIVKKYTGISYSDYVNHLRLESAKTFLLENELSINDIAFKLGYGSSNTFIRTFKSYEGVTPGQFKISSMLTDKLKSNSQPEI